MCSLFSYLQSRVMCMIFQKSFNVEQSYFYNKSKQHKRISRISGFKRHIIRITFQIFCQTVKCADIVIVVSAVEAFQLFLFFSNQIF